MINLIKPMVFLFQFQLMLKLLIILRSQKIDYLKAKLDLNEYKNTENI